MHLQICDYDYPISDIGEEAHGPTGNLSVTLISGFSSSFIPFSQETISSNRCRFVEHAQGLQNWFRTRAFHAQRPTVLTPGQFKWKEMQPMWCDSYSKGSLKKMEMELSTGKGEKIEYGVSACKHSDRKENHQVDGALELRDMQRKLSPEVVGAIPSRDLWQVEVGSESREGVGETQASSSEAQPHTPTPLTSPRKSPRPKSPRSKVKFNTPNWDAHCRASIGGSVYGTSNPRERKQLEDFPPLSPQVSPKTLPSSEEILKLPDTLWNPTLVDLNIPTYFTTPQSSLHIMPLVQRSSSKNTNKLKKRLLSVGTLGTRRLAHGAAGSEKVVQGPIFCEDIDPGAQKSTLGTSPTFSQGNTLRKSKNAFCRVLASARLIGWRGCDKVEAIRSFDKVPTPAPRVRGLGIEVTSPQDCYPSPPPSPHPGDRVFISWSTGKAITRNGVMRGVHVGPVLESSTGEVGKGKRRALFKKWMRRE